MPKVDKIDAAQPKAYAGDRWMAVGSSSDPDATTAGRSAASEALGHSDAKLLVVFCSDAYDLQALLDGINEQAGGVPVIGCSTAGEIATSGPGVASVVVVGFGGPGFTISTKLARDASKDLRSAGEAVAGALAEVSDRSNKVLMLLTDGLAGDQQEIVRGAYAVVGAAIPLVGGCAGDDLKMKATYQLYGDEVLTNAVIGAALGSDAPFGIGVRHGWRRVGEPMVVTRSANNRVYSLDGDPALDVYLKRLGVPELTSQDPAAFTQFASTHPLGVSPRGDEPQVRFVGGANFEDRSLECIAEVPQGGLVSFMEGDEESVLEATDAACRQATDKLGDSKPLGVIAFDCIARKGVLGDAGIQLEVDRIAEHASGSPVAGFYTYGEIARTKGISGFHNQTLVVLAVG